MFFEIGGGSPRHEGGAAPSHDGAIPLTRSIIFERRYSYVRKVFTMFSDPVVGENFFGRQEIIDLLIKRTNALKSGYRQNVAIIGHRQLGKSSILRQYLHLTQDPEVLAIYVEIKLQALDFFVDQFIRALLYEFLSRQEVVGPTDSLECLSEKASRKLPRTVSKIKDIAMLVKHRHAEEAYSKLFELTTIIKQETGKNCVVILDEFHRLGEFGIRNSFSDFGKRIMVQKDTMYILASSSFSASRKILAEKLSLLFGNFERVYLEPFDFGTSFGFLESKLSPVRIPKTLQAFLAAFTDGHPFFLESIASRLKEISLAKGEGEISPVSVAETLLKLLFESQGILNQYFSKLISPWTQVNSKGSHLLILTELAKGKNRLKDLSAAVNRRQSETSRQLKELMEYELIVKNGVFYRFHDKMFKFWLREVYEKKELSLLGTPAKIESFLARILEHLAEFQELARMDISERVASLFGLFRNDLIEMGERKRQLPHFTEILRFSDPGNAGNGPQNVRKLIAKGHGRCWVCKIVEEKATEKEVLDLLEADPSDKDASKTRVLVALKGFEENARLLAKEKKVLTLGLSRLNFLMDLYGKSPVLHE